MDIRKPKLHKMHNSLQTSTKCKINSKIGTSKI